MNIEKALKGLRLKLVHSWYSNWIESEDVKSSTMWNAHMECKLDHRDVWAEYAGSQRCLMFMLEREWSSNGSKISAAFEESEKNRSNISIKDTCSIEESEIISPMMNLCRCLTFRNKHRGANPSNVQINYVEHYLKKTLVYNEVIPSCRPRTPRKHLST